MTAVLVSGVGTHDVTVERDRIIAQLRATGLRVTADPRNVQMPVVFLQRCAMVPLGNACQNLRIEWTAWLIAKGPDNLDAWDRLEQMRQKVWPVLLNKITACDPQTFPINETTEAPAFRLTFETVL